MAARQQTIYEVIVKPLIKGAPFGSTKETITYFSNLNKAVDTLHTALGAQGWPSSVSYSSIYRRLKENGWFTRIFVVEGVQYFQLHVTTRILNPHLTTLGIEEMPVPRRKGGREEGGKG